MSALQELIDIAGTIENPAIQDWKNEGKRVVGFHCIYIPEEIFYAADILPFRIRTGGSSDTLSADVYMSNLNCSYIRSLLSFVLDGKAHFMDGLAFTNSCDDARRLHDITKEIIPEKFALINFVDVPKKCDEDAIAWYKDGLDRLKADVEKAFDVHITDEKLKNAIAVYNETRTLLKRLYALRQRENPPLTGTQSLQVIMAATSCPRDRYNRLLGDLLSELEEKGGEGGYRARLMIAGSGGCDVPEYLKIIEDEGGLIVTDALCYGARYFWEPVTEQGDPMLSLATAYLNRSGCARMVDRIVNRIDFIKQMAAAHDVDGIIYQTIRYCQVWGGQIFAIRDAIQKADIPLLELEREYFVGSTGQLKTRVQAFLERIER